MKKTDKKIEDLEKELSYILGRRPDEFGLIPDQEGYISIKDLIQVYTQLGKTLTRNDINEILLKGTRLEIKENKIRAREIFFSIENIDLDLLPNTLFTFIRERAHETVFMQGIRYTNSWVPLFRDRDSALRVGNRRTKDPVILEITTNGFRASGVNAYILGDLILVSHVPKEALLGPRPKVEERTHTKIQKAVVPQELPGSVLLRPEPKPWQKAPKGRKPKGWKESLRKLRKQ